jgi:hypothetical protein
MSEPDRISRIKSALETSDSCCPDDVRYMLRYIKILESTVTDLLPTCLNQEAVIDSVLYGARCRAEASPTEVE